MSNIIEQFDIEIDDMQIHCVHTGQGKPFDELNLNYLRELITDDLGQGVTCNVYPYRNFECMVEWQIVDVIP